MKDKEIEQQINDIIEGEIQNSINEYLEENPEEQKGFNKDAKLIVLLRKFLFSFDIFP